MRSRRPRLQGFDYSGLHAYFLTFCCANRRLVFQDRAIAREVAAQILREAAENAFAVPAYVAMPDHMHWFVVAERDDADMRTFVKIAKQRTGYWYRQKVGQPLWQPSFFDRVLRDGDDPWGVIRYIVDNPVRARPVQSSGDYELWGSSQYTREVILDELQRRPDRSR